MRIIPPSSPTKPLVHFWGDSITNAVFSTGNLLGNIPSAVWIQHGYGGKTATEIMSHWSEQEAIFTNIRNELNIFWLGTNNTADMQQTVDIVAAAVARLTHKNFLVFDVLNGDYPTAYNDQPGYLDFLWLEASLASIYPDNYMPMRRLYYAHYNPGIPQDVIDHGHDIEPSSLRVDSVHPNATGTAAIVTELKARLNTQWPRWFP